MSTETEQFTGDVRLDPAELYREEIFTDLNVGTLRRLTPVQADGSEDPARRVRYVAQTQILTQLGPVPISAEIEADSLAQALERFPEAVRQGIEQAVEEVKEYRREQASRIVVPEPGAGNRIQLK